MSPRKAGINVVLLDRDHGSRRKGQGAFRRPRHQGDAEGPRHGEDKEKLLSLITPTADYADLEGADLVIEAVFEDSEIKKTVTEKAEAV
jgi:3-hydroxyacyl-CoA dehydrogenase/enoyl-CoA hydratase/3-hydroxybutyryl-CoA epimerase